MTNETEAPDRIWVEDCNSNWSTDNGAWGVDRENEWDVEYIRADLSDAQAARIAELEAERDETMREALSLERSLHKTHYIDVTQWEPLDYPAGIISQIDNMVAGIVTRAEAAEAKLAKAEDGLRECEREIDGYIRQEYPYDHPVHERYRQRDFAANPARATLAELTGGNDE